MFKKILFKNFKSFSDVNFDLISRGKPKHIVALYGENGSGKSNIVDSFKLLRLSMDTMRLSKKITSLQVRLQEANDKDDFPDINELVDSIFTGRSFKDLSKNTPRISAKGDTKLEFCFSIENNEGVYIVEYDSKGELTSESLEFVINSNKGNHFRIKRNSEISVQLNKTIFKKGVFTDLQDLTEKFWGKHTFLSIYRDYISSINKDYAKANLSKNFINVIEEFERISIWTDNTRGPFKNDKLLLKELDKGEIRIEDKYELFQTEEIIYKFLTFKFY